MASTLDVSAKLSPSNCLDIRLFCFYLDTWQQFLKMTRLKTLSIELFVSVIFSKSEWNNQRMFSDKRCLSSAFALRCLSLLTKEILS